MGAEAQEMQRRMVLRQIMTPEASERLCRIGLVKKEKQEAVENMLLQAMQRGGLGGKIDESTVIDLLGKYEAPSRRRPRCPSSARTCSMMMTTSVWTTSRAFPT